MSRSVLPAGGAGPGLPGGSPVTCWPRGGRDLGWAGPAAPGCGCASTTAPRLRVDAERTEDAGVDPRGVDQGCRVGRGEDVGCGEPPEVLGGDGGGGQFGGGVEVGL